MHLIGPKELATLFLPTWLGLLTSPPWISLPLFLSSESQAYVYGHATLNVPNPVWRPGLPLCGTQLCFFPGIRLAPDLTPDAQCCFCSLNTGLRTSQQPTAFCYSSWAEPAVTFMGGHSLLSSPCPISPVLGSCSVGCSLARPGLVWPWHWGGSSQPTSFLKGRPVPESAHAKKAASSSFSGFVVHLLFLKPTTVALAATYPGACWENSTL